MVSGGFSYGPMIALQVLYLSGSNTGSICDS